MSVLSLIYVLPLFCNCVVSASILTPFKADGSLRILKEPPSDLEYVLKRHTGSAESRSDDPDASKDRRSSSTFIRYGRSEGVVLDGVEAPEKSFAGDGDTSSKVNRYPRWKSPDIVIRFGRSGFKAASTDNKQYKRGRNDLNFIRYGRNVQVYPIEIDMTTVCSELLSNDDFRDLQPYDARLLRLCNILGNIDQEHRNSLDFLEERGDSKHD